MGEREFGRVVGQHDATCLRDRLRGKRFIAGEQFREMLVHRANPA